MRSIGMPHKLASIGAIAAVAAGGSAHASECSPQKFEPEPGYALHGDTLLLPGGGKHTANKAALRETYGLIGPDRNLIRTRFVDDCGNEYQVGYRIEGATLHTPGGGKHEITDRPTAEAEELLRETYGLVGERNALARTKW
jgi:hypothetical protein